MARNPNDPFDPSQQEPETQQPQQQNPSDPNGGMQMPATATTSPQNGTFNMGAGGFSPSSPYQGQNTSRRGSFTVGAPSSGGWDYGWDFNNHNGQSFSYDNPAEGAKYAFAKYVQDNNLDPNSADAAAIAQGLNSLYGSNVFRADGNRRVSYGDEFVDWSGQGKPAGQWFWGSAAPAGSVGGGAGNVGAGTAAGTGHTGSSSGAGTGQQATISAAIQQLLQQGMSPVTQETINSQYLPARNAMERQAQIGAEQAAQRAAAQGVPQGGGSQEGIQASAAENLGSAEAQLSASLIGQELDRRRQQLELAIQSAQGQERLRLQEALQQLNYQIQQAQVGLQQQSINNQNTQWWNQFGLNSAQMQYLLNQNFQQGLSQ